MRKNLFIVLCIFAIVFILLSVEISQCINQPSVEHHLNDVKINSIANPLQGTVPLAVHFEGSVTSDTPIDFFQWNFGDGVISEKQTTNHTFQKEGTYNVTLTVIDNNGYLGSNQIQIIAEKNVNSRPTVILHANPTEGKAPLTVSFRSFIQTDSVIESYAWDFGDGSTSDQPKGNHTFEVSGTFTVTLNVTDADGAMGAATMMIHVEDPGNTSNSSLVTKWFDDIGTGDIPGGGQGLARLMTWISEKLGSLQGMNKQLSDLLTTNTTNDTENFDMLAANAEHMKEMTDTYIAELNNMSNVSADYLGIKNDIKLCIYVFKLSCYYTYKGAMAMLKKDYRDAPYYFSVALSYRCDTLACLVRLTSMVESLAI